MLSAALPFASDNAPSVTILEWVCGGGLLGTPQEEIPKSLLAEGQAMLQTLVHGLAAGEAAAGGVKPLVPLDVRLLSHDSIRRIAAHAQIIELGEQHSTDWLEIWCQLAGQSSWSWLVAPELNDTLRHIADCLRSTGAQLLNASDDFLRAASDKLYCSELWHTAGILHPPTRRLDAIDDGWLSRTAQESAGSGKREFEGGRWVVKPVDGAGGEGLTIVDCRQLLQLKSSPAVAGHASWRASAQSRMLGANAQSRMIVQPWLSGIAASCSAIVDSQGRPHWLPLVSQDFAQLETQVSNYLGCTYPAPGIPHSAPTELLNRTLQALPGTPLGWIGIDLLYNPLTHAWWAIEINPRCTSSIVGLATAYSGNLVYDSYQLQTDSLSRLADQFEPIIFRIEHRNNSQKLLNPIVQSDPQPIDGQDSA